MERMQARVNGPSARFVLPQRDGALDFAATLATAGTSWTLALPAANRHCTAGKSAQERQKP